MARSTENSKRRPSNKAERTLSIEQACQSRWKIRAGPILALRVVMPSPRAWAPSADLFVRAQTNGSTVFSYLQISRDTRISRWQALPCLESTSCGQLASPTVEDESRKVELTKILMVRRAAPCCAFAGKRRIVAGDWGGRVYFLALEE